MSLTTRAATPQAGEPEPLNLWNCLNCRRRKIRCNRQSPCLHCSKGGLECAFPVSGRTPTRRDSHASITSSKTKQMELLSRLRHLESVVEELTKSQEAGALTPSSIVNADPTPRAGAIDLPRDIAATTDSSNGLQRPLDGSDEATREFGRMSLSKDGSLYIGDQFWAALSDVAKHVREALIDESEFESESSNEQPIWPTESILFSARDGGVFSIERSQPLPSQMPYIWQIFVENVDPCLKILHLPTISKAIRDSKGKFSSLTPGMVALMFAISLAAITSLSDEEVEENFHDIKIQVITRLTLGTEHAFSRAGILDNPDLTIVQALSIYLEALGQINGIRRSWLLTGILVRMAVSMGLHRDSAYFANISPFEAEIRRRVWWHICFIDIRVGDAQASEVSISDGIFDTKEPTNLEDTDITLDMTESPRGREGATDTTLCLVRCELWRIMRRIHCFLSVFRQQKGLSDSSVEKEMEYLQVSAKRIEMTFLCRLEPKEPMHSLIINLARLSLAQAELLVENWDHPCGNFTASSNYGPQRNKTFLTAIASLDIAHALETRPSTRNWSWILRGSTPWHVVSILLVQLCWRPWGPTSEQAWISVKRVLGNITGTARNESLRRPVWKLLAAARRHRDQELERIKADPVVMIQLGLLVEMEQPVLDSWVFPSTKQVMFDTSAAEKRLERETAVSMGTQILQPLDSMDGAAAWQELALNSVGTTTLDVDTSAATPAPSELSNQTSWPSTSNNQETTARISPCLKLRVETRPESAIVPDEANPLRDENQAHWMPESGDAEMDWPDWNLTFGTDDVPW